ncbi:MAG TPA: hypothetical protein VFS67_02445 [Polyangiaceae bacterium]|nr:hypothetical protein [Polyangiaceae bacterium]
MTGVGGKFNRAGDVVQIVSQGGRWLLTGSVDSAGTNNFVEARAACLPASTVTNEVNVQALPSARGGVDLESPTTHACFFTRIAGSFRTGSENVQLGTATGVWRLSGSAQQEAGVSASARCMPMQPLSENFLLAFGATSPLTLDPTLNGACYLTRASGEFESEGDLIETEWIGTVWQLQRAAGSTLQAAAVCFGKNEGGVPALP